ncbi:MAG: hypothetical protein V1720_00275 [bacterium]
MDRKTKNTIILLIILILIAVGGSLYTFVYQKGKIKERQKQVDALKMNALDTQELQAQLYDLQLRAAELDSILALRKYNIPLTVKQSSFFDFINKVSFEFSPHSFVNIEYNETKPDGSFFAYVYTISGTADFNDLYKMIYAIEESKELKKVIGVIVTNFIKVDEEGIPYYLVSYSFKVNVYFSNDARFSTASITENKLKANPLYNIFYPLIRNEIVPNMNNLLDVQTAHLLALIPDGAFVSDASGNTFLLMEGDEVYLGYLTDIDYQKNEVNFVLNKGGIIERVTLQLDRK